MNYVQVRNQNLKNQELSFIFVVVEGPGFSPPVLASFLLLKDECEFLMFCHLSTIEFFIILIYISNNIAFILLGFKVHYIIVLYNIYS